MLYTSVVYSFATGTLIPSLRPFSVWVLRKVSESNEWREKERENLLKTVPRNFETKKWTRPALMFHRVIRCTNMKFIWTLELTMNSIKINKYADSKSTSRGVFIFLISYACFQVVHLLFVLCEVVGCLDREIILMYNSSWLALITTIFRKFLSNRSTKGFFFFFWIWKIYIYIF